MADIQWTEHKTGPDGTPYWTARVGAFEARIFRMSLKNEFYGVIDDLAHHKRRREGISDASMSVAQAWCEETLAALEREFGPSMRLREDIVTAIGSLETAMEETPSVRPDVWRQAIGIQLQVLRWVLGEQDSFDIGPPHDSISSQP